MLHLPTLTAFVICTFSLHKGFPAALMMFLLFFPKCIFHKYLLIAVFLSRKTGISQSVYINLVSIFTYMCLRESACQTAFTEEVLILLLFYMGDFSLKDLLFLANM